MEVIEKENEVVVLESINQNLEEKERIEIDEDRLIWGSGIDEEAYDFAVENTSYQDGRPNPSNGANWPIKVTTSHHLEETVDRRLHRQLYNKCGSDGSEFFKQDMGGRLNLPSIELIENWLVHKDGSVELQNVGFSGSLYKKEH